MNGKVTVLAVVMLMAVPSALAWTQLAGDAGRSGIAHIPDGPLDVIAVVDIEANGVEMDVALSPGAITTPEGLLVFVQNQTNLDCYLAAVTAVGEMTYLDVPDCSGNGRGGTLVGFDEVRGLAFLCLDVFSPLENFLYAVDVATGESPWAITPQDLLDVAPSSQGPASETSGNNWECRAGAMDDELGQLYVPAVAYGGADGDANRGTNHRIAAIQTDEGELQWVTYLDASIVAQQESDTQVQSPGELLEDDSLDPSAPFQRTEVDAITRTAIGLVVAGQINDGGMALTMDLEGNIISVHQAAPTGGVVGDLLETETGTISGNAWATATGPLAIMGLGSEVVLLDPLASEAQFRTAPSTTQPFAANRHIGPVLLQDIALVPARNALIAMDSGTFQIQWQHLAAPSVDATSLLGAMTASDGRIYTLEAHPNHGVRVVLLDHVNGRSLADWPLPINVTSNTDVPRTRLTAAPGLGLVVLQESSATSPGAGGSAESKIIILGEAVGAPSLGLLASTTAPQSGEPLELTIDETALDEGVQLTVHWGDGSFNQYDSRKNLEHIYFGSGEKAITAVAVRPDGTTYSETLTVDVDGVHYSWIQEQFLPDNLDMTWGVIGIALGLVGGSITFIVTTLRRRRMKNEMDQLDAIRVLAVDEPIMAMGRLRAYRHDLRERAKAGKLDDPPLGSILQEVSKLFHVIEQRMLTSFGGRMSSGMRNAMDAAFADGVLSKQERTDLQKRLGRESKLSSGERNDLHDLLQNWV